MTRNKYFIVFSLIGALFGASFSQTLAMKFEEDEIGFYMISSAGVKKYNVTLGKATYPIKDYCILEYTFVKEFKIKITPLENIQNRHMGAVSKLFEDYLLALQEPTNSWHYLNAFLNTTLKIAQAEAAFLHGQKGISPEFPKELPLYSNVPEALQNLGF